MNKQTLDLALIGNCAIGALVNKQAEVVWCCMPRFDGEPVFASLLQEATADRHGAYQIIVEDFSHSEQEYVKNTAIVVTRLYDRRGSGVAITDFVPRFNQFGRTHRPASIFRKLEPLGCPRVTVKLRPAEDDCDTPLRRVQGSNHVDYIGRTITLRLTTNISVTAIMDEIPFILDQPRYLILGHNEAVEDSIPQLVERFLKETESYWLEWSRYLSIPFEWQDAVIRAAITLKLSAFEDTGAIIAAFTTSIPEAPNAQRNWDYRFCWLRDSYFTVHALNRLGTTRTMEQYLQYLVNIVAQSGSEHLQPVYCINGSLSMPERISAHLEGYRGIGPVRFGNQAAEQIQHDVYGAVVLSAIQMFFDERIRSRGNEDLFYLLEQVGERAYLSYKKPDAGLWELRGSKHIHTFSSIMCWVACDRLAKIASKMVLQKRHLIWLERAEVIHREINDNAYNDRLQSYTATWGGDTMDASLLLACELGFVKGDDPKFVGTVKCVEERLKPERSKYLFRYVTEDDFGAPENAFTICSFWYIDALAACGRKDEARVLFEDLLSRRNHLGLLSEDINPETGELWGNFPQTYSMVGIINSARLLSKSWEEAL